MSDSDTERWAEVT